MASNDSQDWRQWYILPMTILSVDYRFADLLRLMIANKIIWGVLAEQQGCLNRLFVVGSDANKPHTKDLHKQYKVKFESTEEELRLENVENFDVEDVFDLCKDPNGQFKSTIRSAINSVKSFKNKMRKKTEYFTMWRKKVVEMRQWALKSPKIDKLIIIMKTQKISVGHLMQIIKGDGENFKEAKPITPRITLEFNQKSRDLIDEIILQLQEEKSALIKDLQDIVLEQKSDFDYISQPTLNPEEWRGENYTDQWLEAIRVYRNGLIHPPADEISLERLYEKKRSIEDLCHPYVKFLLCVNFEKLFPSHLLKEKVKHFLCPFATAAEMEVVQQNYKKLIDELGNRKQAIEQLEDTVKGLRDKGKEELSCVEEELFRQLKELKEKEEQRRKIKEDYEQLQKSIRTKDKTRGEQIRLTLDKMKKRMERKQPEKVAKRMKKLYWLAEEIEMGTASPKDSSDSDSDSDSESDGEEDVASQQKMKERGLPNRDRNRDTEDGSKASAVDVTSYQKVKKETGPPNRNSGTEGGSEGQEASYQKLEETTEMGNEGKIHQAEDDGEPA